MTFAGDKNYCGISMPCVDYDDGLALRAYVAKHCREFMTPLERRVTEYTVPLTSEVDDQKFSRLYQFLESRDGHVEDDETVAAFGTPWELRETQAVSRVIEECYNDLPINRCLECKRLVRTPLARQCLWCGHDWHSGG